MENNKENKQILKPIHATNFIELEQQLDELSRLIDENENCIFSVSMDDITRRVFRRAIIEGKLDIYKYKKASFNMQSSEDFINRSALNVDLVPLDKILEKGLTENDKKEIAEDTEQLVSQIFASYEHMHQSECDDNTKLRIREAIRLGLSELKKENKVKYESFKNSFVPLSRDIVMKLETNEGLRLYQLLQSSEPSKMQYVIAYLAQYLINDTKSDYEDSEIVQTFVGDVIEPAINDLNNHIKDRKIEYSVQFDGQTCRSITFSYKKLT